MLKRFEELNRTERIDLLQLIASGEIGRDYLDSSTMFAIKPEDAFVSMLSRLTSEENGTETNIIEIGQAREASKQSQKFAEEVAKKYPEGVPVKYLL